jgi:hypothetical protein
MDARAPERFRGENETIDPIAGHIPGAISAPYGGNLNPDGTFRSAEQLLKRYQRFLGQVPVENSISYCGSGVTSIHNILAMLHAGLGEGRLYVGSWVSGSPTPLAPSPPGMLNSCHCEQIPGEAIPVIASRYLAKQSLSLRARSWRSNPAVLCGTLCAQTASLRSALGRLLRPQWHNLLHIVELRIFQFLV